MATKRVISVNESSLVDLKAELYRKETQFRKEKVVDSSVTKKSPIWQKKKKKAKKENIEELKISSDESTYDKELEKSRLMLEAKSALYDKLSTGEIEVPSDEDDQDGRFLVDFHQKTITKENKYENDVISSAPLNPDDEWVDYVDSFGRSRKCLRKDISLMKEKGEILTENNEKPTLSTSYPTLLSDDMRREMIRNKWEKEMEETLDKPVGPVHYQFEETRDHGVGYYQFSKAEEERQEQQTLLKNLRTQTEQQRDKREKLLTKRKAAMDARLLKVKERKIRKLKEQGLVVDDEINVNEKTSEVEHEGIEQEETSNIKDENEIAVGDMVERIRNTSTRIEYANKWEKNKIDLSLFDKPKPKTPSYNPQSERNPDFAPPSFYAKTENTTINKKNKWNNERDKQEKKTTRIEEWEIQNSLIENDITYQNNSYSQESSILTNAPQGSVDINLPPLLVGTHHNLQPPNYHTYPPPLRIPPNLPPPSHTFPQQPTLVGNIHTSLPPSIGGIPPNLPLPPTHAFPPPSTLFGNIPPSHAFPPPPFLTPPFYPPPQFSTTPYNNYSNIQPQPPGDERY